MSIPAAEVDVAALWTALETAADLAGCGVYMVRVDVSPPQILYVSPRASAIVGRPAAELIGQPPWVLFHMEHAGRVRELTARPPGASPMFMELQVLRPDGTTRLIEGAASRITTTSGAILTFGFVRDVSAEHATRAALAASEARFTRLIETAPDGVMILRSGLVVFMNAKAASLLGVAGPEDAIGRPIVEFLPPEDAAAAVQRIMTMIETGIGTLPQEYGVLAVPGRTIEIKAVPCDWEDSQAVLAFARDVTERKELERRLADADRVAAQIALAAGVAHEINNPLTYAQLGLQRIERSLATVLPSDVLATVRAQLRDVEHGITRVAAITQGLRAFARADEPAPASVELPAAVGRALQIVDPDHAPEVAPLAEVAPPAEIAPPDPDAGRRKILIIDDEPLVRDVLARLLGADHEVATASSGEAGLAAIQATRFDVIICDMMMPKLDGRAVHRRIAAEHPGLEQHLVFISGGTFTPELDEFLATTPNAVLPKPFTLEDVLRVVEQAARR